MPSEKITLHEIKCPNCGATISRFNAFAVTCRCPNCDKIFQILGGAHRRDIDRPEHIFPFRITKEEFRKRFSRVCKKAFSRDFAEKVRLNARFGDETPFYVAAYCFVPGETLGGAAPATDDERLPVGIAECLRDFRYDAKTVRYFSPEILAAVEDCVVVDAGVPESFAREKYFAHAADGEPSPGVRIEQSRTSFLKMSSEELDNFFCDFDDDFFKSRLDGDLFSNLRENLKNCEDISTSSSCSSFSSTTFRSSSASSASRSTSCGNGADSRVAYIPVWRLGFTFEGEDYHYTCIGFGQTEKFSLPQDPARVRAERERREAKLKAERERLEEERKAEREHRAMVERKKRWDAEEERTRQEEKSEALMGIVLIVVLMMTGVFIVAATMFESAEARKDVCQIFLALFILTGALVLLGQDKIKGGKAVGLGCLTALLCLFGLIAAIVILCI